MWKKLESLEKKSEGAKKDVTEPQVVEYNLEVACAKSTIAERAFL